MTLFITAKTFIGTPLAAVAAEETVADVNCIWPLRMAAIERGQIRVTSLHVTFAASGAAAFHYAGE